MQIFRDIKSLQKALIQARIEGKSVGLVPTMGALHLGHASLINSSLIDNDLTVCSIFVNPAQFNNTEDLKTYPRTIEKDISLLESLGCNMLFCPDNEGIYANQAVVKFDFGYLESKMEGAKRPGHFNGVGLIVTKLFNIANPNRAYFGQKDLQQFKIVDQLVKDLSFNIELKCIPTVREEDGLAMSSRNTRLSNDGRKRATNLNKMLVEAESLLANGNQFYEIKDSLLMSLNNERIEVEYLELVDAESLIEFKSDSNSKEVALCIAAVVDGVRLIDNRIFKI